MSRFKYPAPFDPPDPGPMEIDGAPLPPSPPLPIVISGTSPPPSRTRTLYGDLFGDDTAPLHYALSDQWPSAEHRLLAEQLIDGRKNMSSLNQEDRILLDSLAEAFATSGASDAQMQPDDNQRLSLSQSEKARQQEDQDVQSEEGPLLHSRMPRRGGDYDWLKGS